MRRERQLTLIEILVAIVVMAVGLVGILSLLSASASQSGQIAEDSFAATLVRSVHESVRVGVREHAFVVEEGGKARRGFLLFHKGVTGPVPAIPSSSQDTGALRDLRASDRAVFLPEARGSDEVFFVFPRPNDGDNDGDGVDNFLDPAIDSDHGTISLDIKRTYQLRDGDAVDPRPVSGGTGELTNDLSDQYSFALVVRRASAPPLTQPDGRAIDWSAESFLPKNLRASDGLYQVRILVFRNFSTDQQAKSHVPVSGGDHVALVALGP